MADRAKTLLSAMPAISAIAHSSRLNASYDSALAGDKKCAQVNPAVAESWLSQSPPVYPEWVRFDFGSAKTFDSSMIAGAYDANSCIKNGGIEYSADAISWSSAYEFTNLFGGAAPANPNRMVIVTFTAQSARYWRIRIDAAYTNVQVGTHEWILWDSSTIGSRLDNGGSFVLTSPGATASSAAEMSNRVYLTYGLHWNRAAASDVCGFNIDLGSSQYVGGIDALQYYTGNFWPSSLLLFTSTNGTTWTLQETITPEAQNLTHIASITFTRIYYTRYFRIIPTTASSGALWQEWFLYATLTPAAPADPTSVMASSGTAAADASAIHVRWSHAEGDDNAAADVVFDVTRQKDGGGYSSVATGVTGKYYVDSGLAAGSYDYKVQARNLYHARTSSAVQSSASVTVPAAAGGGGRTGAVSSQLVGASRQP